jgi:hypothetical protein
MDRAGDSVTAAVANTESCFSNSTEPQVGQAGCVPLRTKASNSFAQLRHAYSKMGI